MKKGLWLAVALILCVLFLAACVPTPDNAAVQQKRGETLIERIDEPATSTSYEFPETYSLAGGTENGEMDYVVDADIIAENREYPVYAVVPYTWTQEDVGKWLELFIGDRQLCYCSWQHTVESQDTLLYYIAQYREMLEVDPGNESIQQRLKLAEDIYVDAPAGRYDTPAELEFHNLMAEGELQALEQQWNSLGMVYGEQASQSVYETEYSKALENLEDTRWLEVTGVADFGDDIEALVNIEIGDTVSLYYEKYNWKESLGFENVEYDPLSISEEEAIACAEEYLTYLGIDFMAYCRGEENRTENGKIPIWSLLFTRQIGDTVLSSVFHEDRQNQTEVYRKPWSQEYIRIGIGNDGVVQFMWQSPMILEETLNENVSLLPMDEIMDIFVQQFTNTYAYFEEVDSTQRIHRSYDIYEIGLSYMIVPQQGNSNNYLVLPVWDFYGTATFTYRDDYQGQLVLDENHQRVVYGEENVSLITINAIDGTVVNRTLGY